MLTLYTPGHSPYTDTLIMYGLTYPVFRMRRDDLQRSPSLVAISGLGGSYAITMGVALDELCEYIVETVKLEAEYITRELTPTKGETWADGRVGLVDAKDVESALSLLGDKGKLMSYIDELTRPGHGGREGRLGRGRLKAKLYMMPTAGKYFHVDLTQQSKFQVKEYSLCEGCASIALLGLYAASIPSGWGNSRLITLFTFDGTLNGLDINNIYGANMSLVEELRCVKELRHGAERQLSLEAQLLSSITRSLNYAPIRVASLSTIMALAAPSIKAMVEADASWRLIAVKFDVARGIQIRGYCEEYIDSFIESLFRLIDSGHYDQMRHIVRHLLSMGARDRRFESDVVSALDKLYSYLEVQRLNDLYSFIRSYDSLRERCEGEIPVIGRRLCEELLKLGGP